MFRTVATVTSIFQLLVVSVAEIPHVTPNQLLMWPDEAYEYYLIVSKSAPDVEDSWIENSLSYLSGRSVGLAKVDCSNDATEACQLVEKHHVVLFKRSEINDLRVLKSHPQNEKDFIRSLLELLVEGLHQTESFETSNDVETVAGSNGALVTLVNDTGSQEYLMYLKQLPDMKEKLESLSLITLHSADAIPPKKKPRRPAPLDVWFVVSIADKVQWLPMGRNKSNDVITDIMNFIKPLQYPILHEYHPQKTPKIYKDSEIDIVYVLMRPEHRNTSPMDTVLLLARKYIGHFSFITTDFNQYGLKISDVQLPESLGDSPYIIIKPKNYDQLVHASPVDVPFEFDLLSGLLTSVVKRDFEKERAEAEVQDIPLSNDLITFDTLRDFKEVLPSTEHYILVGFCKKGSPGCQKLSQLMSPIATVSSGLHNNLVIAIVECNPTDRLPGGLLIKHLPSVAFFDHMDKSWTEYRQKKSLDGINSFLSDMIELNPVEEHGGADDDDHEKRMKEEFINSIIKEFSAVTEDDEMGLLANKLGAADLKGISQLTDKSVGPFLDKYSNAIVTFYQRWCVVSKVFLHHVVSLNKLVTSDVGVAVVSCSDWPDVCDKYNITTYPTVLLFRDTQITSYRGHMTAHSIKASLPYYNAPMIQQLTASSVKEFIVNCNGNSLLGVLGIFPDTTTASYQNFVDVASRYHGHRLFSVLESSTIPEGLPVEVTTLPTALLVGGAPQVTTDLDKLEYALLTANELTPESLPYYLSADKPLMVLVVTSTNSLVETAASLYPIVTWLDYSKYGAIIERYMKACSQLPVLLIFDFSAGAIYHCTLCGEKLSANEIENFVNHFSDGNLTPTAHFETKQWKPLEPPFKFPSQENTMDDPYREGHSKFDDYEEEMFYGNSFHTEEHTGQPQTKPPHTEL